MRKTTLAAVLMVTILVGCLKNEQPEPCSPKTVESEMPVMTKYASDSSISTTQDATGLLYQIIDPGTGATPNLQSAVRVKYTGRTMAGTIFDESQTGDQSFVLGGVIRAWQIALPKIKAGGKIKLISPSILAYSCNPYAPAALNNQPLYFYVELLSVQ